MANVGDTGVIINASELLGGVKLSYGQGGHEVPFVENPFVENVTGAADDGSPLTQVAAALKESFYKSSWAVAGSGTGGPVSAGAAPEVYTTALRAALVEYGDSPTATLPDRLRAADGLAAFLGMSSGAHEALMLRALAANEKLVLELQAQAHALRHHRCGLTSADFTSKEAYATWRARALRSVRAALLAQQRLPEYNALLEVSLLGANELAVASKGGKGFMCCFTPDVPLICPYAWAHLVVPSGAGGAGSILGARTQHTQVLMDSGPNPSWQAVLQPLTLTNEQSELRLKVSQCGDPRGNLKSQDQVLGVSGITVAGLQPAVTQQVVLPLYEPPPHPRATPSSSAPVGPNDHDPNVFYRVVYDTANDEIWGIRDLKQQGRIVLKLRYIVERRTRYDVPNEAVFCGSWHEGDSDDEGDTDASRVTSGSVFLGGRDERLTTSEAIQKGSEAIQKGIGKGVEAVVTGAKVTVDYLQHLTHALAQGLTDNALTNMVGINGSSKIRHVAIQLVGEPLNLPRTPSITKLNLTVLIKQLAMALASAARSGRANEPAAAALAVLPMMPTIPEDIRALMLSPSQKRANHMVASGKQIINKRTGQPVRSPYAEAQQHAQQLALAQSGQMSTAVQETWSLLEDAMVKPYLPFGPAIGVFLRAGLLLGLRVETMLILIVQHMLGDWSAYIGSTIKGRGDEAQGAWGNSSHAGGAQDYLHALRVVWEKCLTWHAGGSLVQDETEGIKGIMGLLLSRILPALEQHYKVFVGEEGPACFTMLLEMVGWAWTWDPKAPTPHDLLTDYLKDTATQTMKQDFRVSAANLTKDIERLVTEVEIASECLKRDRDIQLLMPGMKGFAANNASARYDLIFDHLEALALYEPGNSLEAMQKMFDLEVVLMEHHRLLVEEGYARALPPCPVPKHLLPNKGADAGAKTDAKLPTPAVPDAAGKFTNGGLGRDTAGEGVTRSSQIRHGARHEAVTNLWDWEDHFIKELCRWVRVGVSDLDGRVTRLLEAETWVPASRTTTVSNSSLELTKLIEAHATAWLDAACAGSEARRLHVGLLITACLGHVHHHYIAGATAIWEQELAAREALFTGMKGTSAGSADIKRSGPSNGALGADACHHGASMSASPLTGHVHQSGVSLIPSSAPFIPGLASASAPVLVRVISLQVGMTDPSQADDLLGPGIPLPAATVPPGPRHGHKRSASQSTVFASNLVLGEQFGNLPALRALMANALSDHQGICLTKKMAVIRASMHRAMQEAKEVGVFLLQCLVLPFVTPTDLPRTGSELLEAAAAKNKGPRITQTDSDDDSDVDAPVRPSLSSMRHSSANARTSGSGDGGWGRKKDPAPSGKHAFASMMVRNGPDEPDTGAGWARKKPANAGHLAGRLSVPVGNASDGTGLGQRTGSGEAGQPSSVAPISNFVGAYWQELQRRTAAVITSLVSSYSVALRSALVSMMVASCGTKRDPVKPEEHADPTILQDLLRAVDEELTAMSQGMDGEAVLVAEMTGALWRAATSALQLLALNQAGFRPLTEQECENLREFLLTLQKMFENDVPKLVNDKQPPLNWEKVSDPRYPQELAAINDKLAKHPMRQFSGIGGLQPQPVPPELLASLDVLTPVLPEDDAARRSRSRDYCAALLQLAPENASVLQDMYRSQEASMHYAQPLGAAKAVYIPLSPQQLPLLDLLRLMRARRVHEKASAAWADQMLKEAGAVITQVLFGLVGSERVVAEFKCVLAGASKSAGRLIITQGTLCFTTMLDTDARAAFDTTLSILRSKVVSVSAGCEAGSLVLTTSDHDILAFTTFASTAERDRLMTLLTSPASQQGPGGRVLNASTTLKQRDSAALQQRNSVANVSNGTAAGKAMQAGATGAPGGNRTFSSVVTGVNQAAAAKAVAGSAASAGAATGVAHALGAGGPHAVGVDGRSAFSELALGGRADSGEGNGMVAASFTTGDVQVAGPTKTRRPPNRDPWAARAAREAEEARAAEQAAREAASVARREEEARRAAAELARLEAEVKALEEAKARANPPPPPASPPSAPSGEGSRDGSQAPDFSDAALIMSVPCSLYGTIYDTPGVLWVYEDRIEFVSKDAALLHRVAVSEVMSVTQYTGYIGGTRLVVKVDQPNVAKGVALLEFTGLSDALITSLKQSIIDLT